MSASDLAFWLVVGGPAGLFLWALAVAVSIIIIRAAKDVDL